MATNASTVEETDVSTTDKCSVCERYTDSDFTLHIRASNGRLVNSSAAVCEDCVEEVSGR